MDRIFGLLLLTVYIVVIVGLAAVVTFVVVRVFPTQRAPKPPDTPESPSGGTESETAAGRLFRKAKRGAA